MYKVKYYELPATTQKSYYGKAYVLHDINGKIYLKSYNTFVCSIDRNGNFARHWNGYSRTTANHVNDFCKLFGLPGGNKKWWDNLPVKKAFNQPVNLFFYHTNTYIEKAV